MAVTLVVRYIRQMPHCICSGQTSPEDPYSRGFQQTQVQSSPPLARVATSVPHLDKWASCFCPAAPGV